MVLILCEQRRKLLQTGGNILVRGGAGSGKTTIALAKACSDLEAGQLGEAGTALFLSFARATVARVAEQAMATIPRALMRRIEVSTYHGFAWNVLKSHGYLLCERQGVTLLLPAKERAHLAGLDEVARGARRRQLFNRDRLVTFDLCPTLLTELFAAAPMLASAYGRAYPLVIVDEFQDTNSEEWRMIAQIGRYSRLMALGDPKQRIYEFKGAHPRRFDEYISAFQPTVFDFRNENNRSAGTSIPTFADDLINGAFSTRAYTGVTIRPYRGQSLRPLKEEMLRAVGRLRRTPEWSLAILVPANALAVSVFNYMGEANHGLPRYPVDIVIAAEGPTLAANLIALLMERDLAEAERVAAVLDGLTAFELGRTDEASASALQKAGRYTALATAVRTRGSIVLGPRGIGPGVQQLVRDAAELAFIGEPVADWRAVRALFNASDRSELQAIGTEARHMRLLRRGAQIEGRLAEAWRTYGAYRDARALLAAAIVEDQFAATTRPQQGVSVMTIHKSKGKEFDEVIVFEGIYQRFLQRRGAEGERSARLNLHVAVTRARRAVTVMTPQNDPCRLLH